MEDEDQVWSYFPKDSGVKQGFGSWCRHEKWRDSGLNLEVQG